MGLVSSRDRPDAPLRPTGTAVCLYDLVLLMGRQETAWLGPWSSEKAQVMILDDLVHRLAPELVETGNTTEALLARFAAEDQSGVHPASDLVRIHAAARLIEALWTGQMPGSGLPYRP